MREKQEKKVDKENKKSIQKVTANNKQTTNKKMFAGGGTVIAIIALIAIMLLIIALVNGVDNVNGEKGEEVGKVQSEEKNIKAMEARKAYMESIELVTESNENMEIKQDAEGVNVPVPKGYVGSTMEGENKVSGGYVIYEGTEPVDTEDIWNERKTRNQYVWVPVSKEQLKQMYGIDENGKLWGKLYDFTTDEGTGIDAETGTGVDQVTGATPYYWKEPNGIIKVTSSTNYREPDIVTRSDIPSYLRQYGAREESTEELLMDLEKEFTQSIISIAKYGGFYIGRYETGGLNAEAKVVRMDTNISSQTWYSMYEKCKKLRGANENVVTSMIFGSQFDRALMWIIESDNGIDKEDVATDSQDWGNYSNVQLEYEKADGSTTTKNENLSTRIPAGSSEKTKANNIYDLCGNVCDWTIEACYTSLRVFRGGDYSLKSTDYPARNRDYSSPSGSNSYRRLPCSSLY